MPFSPHAPAGRPALLVAFATLLIAGTARAQWGPPVNISNTAGRYTGSASYEFDANGTIHMAFFDFLDNSLRVYYANNAGGTWTKTQVKSGGSGPALVITPDQTIHIFYNDGGSTRGISKPVNGGTWSTETRIDNSQAPGCPVPDPSHPSSWPTANYFASADGDSTGGIFVTWMSLFNDDFTPRNGIWGRYRSPDGTWGCLELVAGSGDDGNFPGDVHVTHNGPDIYVCWSDRNGCYYRRRASDGTWDNKVTVNNGGSHCRMAFSPTGQWAVTYHTDTGGGASDPWFENFVRTSENQGATWSTPLNISNRNGLDRSPTPVYDEAGNLYVTWELFPCDGCKAEVYYVARIENVWQPRFNLTDRYYGRDGLNFYEEVMKAHNGNLYVVFNSTVDAYEEVMIRSTIPFIELNPVTIQHVLSIGNNLPDETFTVRNAGPGVINYTISDNVDGDNDWINAAPAGGSSTGENDTITISYDAAGLHAGLHSAEITVAASEATNTPQKVIVGILVETVGPDADGDGDVDQGDFGALQHCLTGSSVYQHDPACQWALLDNDTDVDDDDLVIFQNCISGPDNLAQPTCDDG